MRRATRRIHLLAPHPTHALKATTNTPFIFPVRQATMPGRRYRPAQLSELMNQMQRDIRRRQFATNVTSRAPAGVVKTSEGK